MRCMPRTSAVWSSHLHHSTVSEDGEWISHSFRFQLVAYSGCSTYWDGASVVTTMNSSAMSLYGGPRSRCPSLSPDAWHGSGSEDPQQLHLVRAGLPPV